MARNITAALPNCLILIWSPAGSRGFDDGVVVRGNAERARDIADRLHPAANEANGLRSKRSAGGSSSGSAALVVAGECDMAIGGDQGVIGPH